MAANHRGDLERLTRTVRRARFWGACADAFFVAGLLAALIALVLRLQGIAVRPLFFIVLSLAALAALVWGLWAWRAPPPRNLAAWLDRAGGHRGLLLASLAASDGGAAWADHLKHRTPMPRLRTRRLLARALPPLVLLALIAFLPDRAPAPRGRLVASALLDLAGELDAAAVAGELDPATEEKLRERLAELGERDGRPAWTEIDALAQRLAVERETSAPRRAAAHEALSSAAAGESPLRDALRQAADAGLLAKVSPAQLRQLGVDPATGAMLTPRPAAAQAQARLAQAVADAVRAGDTGQGAGERGSGREGGKKADGRQGLRPGERRGGIPGKGGVTRGRGDARLGFLNDTKGDPGRFKATRLPDHAPAPGVSRRVDLRTEAPETKPNPDRGSGGAGAAATGKATGRRVIRPRHRDVVKRYHAR